MGYDVCSEHFVDGVPTPSHPDPSLNMGCDVPQNKSRRELFRQPMPPKLKPKASVESQPALIDADIDMNLISPSSSHSSVFFDHSYTSSCNTTCFNYMCKMH